MTIHVKHRNFHPDIDGFDEDYIITIDKESIPQFKELVNRALNCWDDAPKDLKDLGDMLTHGRITQDHTPPKKQPKITVEGTPITEPLPICEYCGALGAGHFYTCPALI